MNLKEMKRIADARTKGKWKTGLECFPEITSEADELFIAMAANNWDKLMAVVEAAKEKLEWEVINCPACSVDDPGPEVPCYCWDISQARADLREAIEALERE